MGEGLRSDGLVKKGESGSFDSPLIGRVLQRLGT